MTEYQRDILIGCVLGDAYISPKGKIRIEQSTRQKEYLQWKYALLQTLAYPSLPREINRKHTKTKQTYSSIYFDIRQYFRPWRSLFYQEKQKCFPCKIVAPISLAIWYMDDGCWTGKKCVISTESFDSESIQKIQNMFLHHNIETTIGKNRKLTIRKQSHKIFFDLISPYIISSMKYKIPNPVTTSYS